MKCTLFLGSARKNGNTEILLQQIIKGIASKSGEITLFRLAELDIHPCIGCGSCEKTGNCVFQDDMNAIYQSIIEADRIVIGSPIYFYHLTAQTKCFIDRCQTLWSRKYVLNKQISTNADRQGVLVSIAATTGEKIFAGASLTARYAFDAMGCTFTEELLIRGMDNKGAMAANSEALQKAFLLGQKIAST